MGEIEKKSKARKRKKSKGAVKLSSTKEMSAFGEQVCQWVGGALLIVV